ncbi:ferredoxin [Mycobacterium sp. CVI_P3]|uniref:Ferredoxin n=1 Tax=Mycobacterium pinniadriaticum TaxID=2994102 RepID=A0ABT3SKZ3_9MYCO|nr:ferredoxin [Mycobacterium pinniadriaticum]MCX2933768.1 ferredoxin [Mycobacterium pinniadriaticum]MCX2940190.1 ferredoxin [Mycobacterium pinniadriaticum]
MKIEVDRVKCTGMGLCEVAAPAIFEVGEDGQTHVLVENVPDADRAAVEEAVANCPAMALSLKQGE